MREASEKRSGNLPVLLRGQQCGLQLYHSDNRNGMKILNSGISELNMFSFVEELHSNSETGGIISKTLFHNRRTIRRKL